MEVTNESTFFPGDPETAFYHMISHYEEMKVGKQEVKHCPEKNCKYSSNNKSDLKDHINSRHIHYCAFKCELCTESFFTRRNYNRHRKMRHRQELIKAAIKIGLIKRPREEDDEENDSKNDMYKLATPATNSSSLFPGTSKEAYEAMCIYFKRLKICKQEIIKCPERNCQYTCNNKTDLKGHLNSKHIHYLAIECDLCEEHFYTQKALHSHKKSRHDITVPNSSSLAIDTDHTNETHDEDAHETHDEDNFEGFSLSNDKNTSGHSTPSLASCESLNVLEETLNVNLTNPNEYLPNTPLVIPSTPFVAFQPNLETKPAKQEADDVFSDDHFESFEEFSDLSESYSKDCVDDCEIQWADNSDWAT